MLRYLTVCLGVALLAGVSGCAPGGPTSPTAAITNQQSVKRGGTIVSMRKIAAPDSQNPWRKLLVDSAGTQSAGDDKTTPLMEFIIRTDEGTTLSIVQANTLGLHAGERVVILRDPDVRLARPDTAQRQSDHRT